MKQKAPEQSEKLVKQMVVSFDLSTKSCFLLTPSVTLWNSSSFHVKNVSPTVLYQQSLIGEKKLTLWSKSGYVFIKRGKELKKFSNSHSFILKKIRIYFVINFYLFIYSSSDSKSSPGNAERSAATDDKYSVYGIEQTMDKCFHFVLLKTQTSVE